MLSKTEMQSDYYTYVGDDEIDLRQLFTVLLRQWKVIAGVVALVVGSVAVMNAFIIPPTYESSVVVQFHNEVAALGVDFPAFRALAESPGVMTEVAKLAAVDVSAAELNRQFNFKEAMDANRPGAPLLSVTVRAQEPQLAPRLVQAWTEAVRSATLRTMESRLADQKRVVEANYLEALNALHEAEDVLARFDQEFPISLMETQLDRAVAKLVSDEQLLENLKNATIPANEAKLQALKEALSEEDVTLESSVILIQPSTAGDMQVTPLNPTYLELRQQMVNLESTLATDRRRVELLEQELPNLKARVDEARAQLIEAKLERERLVRDLQEARTHFEAARRERDQVITLERQLPTRARVEVISEPMLPEKPVAPRKLLNLALGAMIGVMMGVFGVLLAEWWRSPEEAGKSSPA